MCSEPHYKNQISKIAGGFRLDGIVAGSLFFRCSPGASLKEDCLEAFIGKIAFVIGGCSHKFVAMHNDK